MHQYPIVDGRLIGYHRHQSIAMAQCADALLGADKSNLELTDAAMCYRVEIGSVAEAENERSQVR